MLGAGLADGGAGVGGDRQVADAVGWVLVDEGGLVRVDLLDAVEGCQRVARALEIVPGNVHPGEGAEGAVVKDVRVGDRQDDVLLVDAGGLQDVLEVADAGEPSGSCFGFMP